MKNPFSQKEELAIFDGAIGTEVNKKLDDTRGSDLPDLQNVRRPELVESLHLEYGKAGADFLTTNTFSANPFRLQKAEEEERTEKINRTGAELAKRASEKINDPKRPLVAGSIGPSGEKLLPLGDLSFNELKSGFLRQAKALKEGGADWIVIETMDYLREAKAALVAAKETSIPVICSMTYRKDATTSHGSRAESAAVTLEKTGAEVIGANCGTGPEHYTPIVEGLREFTARPILVEPNAGEPKIEGKETVYPVDAGEFYRKIRGYAPYLSGIGSCCGSNPAFTEKLSSSSFKQKIKPGETEDRVTSSTRTLPLPENYHTLKVNQGDLSPEKLRQEKSSFPLIDFKNQKGDPRKLEEQLALDLLRFRSDRPLGFVVRNLDFLEVCLKTYRGIPPIKYTGKDREASKLCRKLGGYLV